MKRPAMARATSSGERLSEPECVVFVDINDPCELEAADSRVPRARGKADRKGNYLKKLGMHRVDGRSYWFAGYFNPFDRELMIRYAGQVRADRFSESFGGTLPFVDARIVRV